MWVALETSYSFHEGSLTSDVIRGISGKGLGGSPADRIGPGGTDLASRAEPEAVVLTRRVAVTVISTLLDGVSVAKEFREAVELRADDGGAEVRSGSLRQPLREDIHRKKGRWANIIEREKDNDNKLGGWQRCERDETKKRRRIK
jgi:hypothetical protein